MISLIIIGFGMLIQGIGLIIYWAGLSSGMFAVAMGSTMMWTMVIIMIVEQIYYCIKDAIARRKLKKQSFENVLKKSINECDNRISTKDLEDE